MSARSTTMTILVLALAAVAAVTAQTPPADQIGEVTLFGEEEFKIQAATKTEIPISKAPGAVTVISAKQIRESGSRTIPELLRRVAGVNVRWNPMVQTVDMRSFGQNPFSSRVLLLIDGVPYNSWNKGGFPQHPGFDFFGLQNVKRIEVLRGPGSALYGENAFWGVINIVTLSGEDLEGGKVELFGGDVETASAGLVYGKKLGEDASILISGKFLESQFPMEFWFEDNDSVVSGTDLFVKGTYKGLEASYYRHEDELDGFSEPVEVPGLPPIAFESIPEIGQEVDIFALKYNRKFKDDKLSFGSDVSFAQRTGSHCGGCHAAPQNPDFQSTDEDHGFQLIGDFRLGLHDLGGHDVLLGLEAREVDAGDHQDELVDPATPGLEGDVIFSYDKLAVYFQDQISLADDSLHLILGARYDSSNDLFGDELSPRIAAVYSPTDALVLRAGWSQAFRFPNFSELYQASWFFTVQGDGGLVIPLAIFQPNPSIEPEQLETFELGFQYRISPALSAKLDLYHSTVDDFVVMAFSEPPLPAVPALRFENHPNEATIRGAELELRWAIPRGGLTGFFNWSYSETDQDGAGLDTTGKPIEFVYAPENKLNLGVYFGPFAGVSGEVDVQWRDDFTAPSFWNTLLTGAEGVAELDGYTYVNLRLSYDLPIAGSPGRNPPRLSVHGRNLLDEEPVETLVGINTRILGRSFYGSFEFSF